MDFEKTFRQALEFQHAGRLHEADALYRLMAEYQNDNPALLHNRAAVLVRLNQLNQAIELLQRAAEIQPGNAGIHIDLGHVLLACQRPEDARAAFTRAIPACCDNVEAATMLGSILLNLQQYQLAMPLYESITKHLDHRPEAWVNLGNVRYLSKQYSKAVGAYLRALQLKPGDPYTLQSLGTSLLKAGRFDECIALLSGQSSPASETILTLASACEHEGLDEKAIELCRQSLSLKEDPAAYIQLGHLHQKLEQLGKAEEAFRNALRMDANNIDAHTRLAFVLERTGQLEAAASIAGKGLVIEPDDPYLLLANATVKRRQGEYRSAERDLITITCSESTSERTRLALEPSEGLFAGDNYILPMIYYELGTCYDRLGESGKAYSAFTRANELKRETAGARQFDKEDFLSEISSLVSVTPSVVTSTRDELLSETSGEEISPVFLVGFPRSGTTLTSNILDSHSSIQVLDEEPVLEPLQMRLSGLPGGYPAALRTLNADQLTWLKQFCCGGCFRNRDSFLYCAIPATPASAASCRIFLRITQ